MPRKPLARTSRRRGAGSRAGRGYPAPPSPDDRAEGPASPVGARRGAGRRPGGWSPPGGHHKAVAAVHASSTAGAAGDAPTRRGWFHPSPGAGEAVGEGWAGLPIPARPRLVHGARPTASLCRAVPSARSAAHGGQAGGEMPPALVGAAGVGVGRSNTPASSSWPPIKGQAERAGRAAAGGVRDGSPKGRDPRSGARCEARQPDPA